MHKGIKGKLVGLSLVAATIAATTAATATRQAEPSTPRPWRECKVTTTDSIPVRSGSQDLRVTISEDLPDPVTASFDPAAKVTVSSVTREPMMNTFRVSLDATEAVAGNWKLTLGSGAELCTGNVKVGTTPPDSTRVP